MKNIIKIFFFTLLFFNCATTKIIVEDKRKNLEPLPENYKKIYPNSNNFTYTYSNENIKEKYYLSLDDYKNTITGLFFYFHINQKNNNKLYTAFGLKYCAQDLIYFNKVIFFAGDKTIDISDIKELNEKRDTKRYGNGLICQFHDIISELKNISIFYNFYKNNQDIKIKFIGKDGQDCIVSVSQQQRKDLVELVDYYRMLTHKSE